MRAPINYLLYFYDKAPSFIPVLMGIQHSCAIFYFTITTTYPAKTFRCWFVVDFSHARRSSCPQGNNAGNIDFYQRIHYINFDQVGSGFPILRIQSHLLQQVAFIFVLSLILGQLMPQLLLQFFLLRSQLGCSAN